MWFPLRELSAKIKIRKRLGESARYKGSTGVLPFVSSAAELLTYWLRWTSSGFAPTRPRFRELASCPHETNLADGASAIRVIVDECCIAARLLTQVNELCGGGGKLPPVGPIRPRSRSL